MEEQVLSPSSSNLSPFSSSLDDLFSAQNTEVDVGLEWLSVFVEDCFSSPGSSLLGPPDVDQGTTTTSKTSTPLQRPNQKQSGLQNFAVPGKARSKRKRLSAPRSKEPPSLWWQHLKPQKEGIGIGIGSVTEPPPLVKQAYWLADSELMVAKKEEEEEEEKKAAGRRCSHCEAQRTPQWRAGPMGPKTLCNACGVRYKSGRLLPEYRPAKSPTFVSNLHSNSHKKVMQMRTTLLSSTPTHHHH